ncbi:MAG TPA: VIT and VWA domain-containing protein [Pyrinomonadaceae bacterium]
MRRKNFLLSALLLATCAVSLLAFGRPEESKPKQAEADATSGALEVVGKDGKPAGMCPLKHTDVKAEISGFLSRVVVTQEFENPFKDKIEAVYTFPLPQAAAVDDMTMRVGERIVHGRILRRQEAQAVYDAARNAGQVASLLDQERPNIFTQSVANIMPGEKVTIEISYVETLKYEDGAYEFVFPMVVGPRYNPGAPTGQKGGGFSPDTTQVPDASRITPQVAAAGTRAGHDISLEVNLDAGVAIDEIKATSHEIEVEKQALSRARIALKDRETIPNKDFVLKYQVAGQKVQDALLTHSTGKGGFFTFILQPPERVTAEDVMPKELVFVLDTSGSMEGFPLEKAKETMKLALDNLYPQDTFNLITFAGDTAILFPQPVPATKENLQKAQKFLETREGGGGTEMMKAIKAALDPSDAQDHVRIVCFMTDGYVGDDMTIIGEVQKHPNARVFSFGIGSSVNRFLLDKMAEEGRGEVEYVSLTDDGSAAARRFHERVRNPLLTDISVDWNGLSVADVYPKRIPDLFGAKPVILTGRYTGSGKGTIKLKGMMSGREFTREIPVEFPDNETRHDVLATLWARTRIDDLMSQDWSGMQQGAPKPEVQETITQLGLEYRLMTQFTSFVAVEEMTVTDGGQPRKIEVPVELPEGVSREGVFGEKDEETGASNFNLRNNPQPAVLSKSVSVNRKNKMIRRPAKEAPPPKGRSGGGAGNGQGAGMMANANVSADMTVDDRSDGPARLSPKERKEQELLAKLHPSIAALIERIKNKKARAGADEAKFVRDNKAEIQIWLTDKSTPVLEELKKLGFEIVLDPQSAKLVIGRIPLDKLAALAELKTVVYISPQMSN